MVRPVRYFPIARYPSGIEQIAELGLTIISRYSAAPYR
jgi:hypothetical protein